MKNTNKQTKAREILWIVVSAMALSTAIHKTIYVSFKESWYFYAFSLIAFLMFLLRKKIRKKENKEQ